MDWPQITMIVLLALGLGITLSKHGTPQSHYNIITSSISTGIIVFLLIAGGFFNYH